MQDAINHLFVDQPFLGSQCDQIRCTMDIEFFQQVRAVFFNGFWADTQYVCNVLVPVPFCNQLQDLPFPLGQGFPRGLKSGRLFPIPKAINSRA